MMISWLLTIASLLGSLLNAFSYRICFVIWIICNIGWIVHDLVRLDYARLILDSMQTIFCIIGFIRWLVECCTLHK